jgi:hypothetical protein
MANYNVLRQRYDGIQTKMKQISDYGCLFLSLCSIIEEVTGKPADIIGFIQKCLSEKWIKDYYTVNDSIAILNFFTEKKWKRIEVKTLPIVINDNEFTVEKWYNPETKGNHFKRRFVDTVTNSNTCRIGGIECYYIYSYS